MDPITLALAAKVVCLLLAAVDILILQPSNIKN
jgi:hypothetical protein